MLSRVICCAWLAAFASLGLLSCDGMPDGAVDAPARRSAQRIITLAPHLAELVVAAGAGDRLVGVSAFTDYPPEAAGLPEIGDAFRVDLEAVAALEPDLILAWRPAIRPNS